MSESDLYMLLFLSTPAIGIALAMLIHWLINKRG